MTKLEKLKNDHEKREQDKQKLIPSADALEKRVREYSDKAREAAVAGNVAEYKAFKAKAEDAEAELYVVRAQLDKASEPISREAAQDAWNEYAANLPKRLNISDKALAAARKQFAASYEAKMDIMVEACKTRQLLGDLMGLQYIPMADIETPQLLGSFVIPFVDENSVYHESQYFKDAGAIDEEKLEVYGHMMDYHKVGV